MVLSEFMWYNIIILKYDEVMRECRSSIPNNSAT